jgi:predicted enzyme related to lactoylglutathione lyase
MGGFKFGGVMIGSEDPETLGKFYAGVFDKAADMSDGGFYGWSFGETWFSIGEHSEVKGSAAEPQRVILNLETPEVQAEFERIRDAGATVVKEPYELEGMQIATLSDPDGNYFQLMSPWEESPEPPA